MRATKPILSLLILWTLSGCAALSFLDDANKGRYFIATSHPEATKAGAAILERGGTAADASVATLAMLGLVEPQSSGIGGGGFLLYWDAEEKRLRNYDGRETAPGAARKDQFLGKDGKPIAPLDQIVNGKSVGVPGILPMLSMAHKNHGTLDWAELFDPAIERAEAGFEISPRLSAMASMVPRLSSHAAVRAYLFDGSGNPLPAGTTIKNEAYAKTLTALKNDPGALQKGEIAEALMAAVGTAGGKITSEDLLDYEAVERMPLCGTYRAHKICGMGPPSSGGVATLQILGMLERVDLKSLGPNSPATLHLIAEASALAFADRAVFLADPDFVRIPLDGLVSPAYLAERAKLIDPAKAGPKREAGHPPGHTAELAPENSYDLPSTAHFTIVDGEGNVAALTATIETQFGSQVFTQGFFLNNELTDFSAIPEADGKEVANRIAPHKRPLSSMSPTIVFDAEGRPLLAIGSAGGQRIIGHVVKTLIGVIDFEMSLQAAIDWPHIIDRNGAIDLEAGPDAERHAQALRSMGHEVKIGRIDSKLYGVKIERTGFSAGADRRAEGNAAEGRVPPERPAWIARLIAGWSR